MKAIEIKNLSKSYFGEGVETRVLRGINLSLEKGDFLAVMGPSGSGKSTLLHIMGLLDAPSGGEYSLFGEDVSGFNDERLALTRNEKMGFVFQSFNLLSKVSVLDNVLMPLYYSKVPESDWLARASEAIKSVGLSERMNYRASALSGGEKQRVAIARALVNNPEIIFADEPTGNLDSKSGQAVMDIIQKLNDEYGRTVVLITHETYTAKHAKKIIKIMDGEIESEEIVSDRRLAGDKFIK